VTDPSALPARAGTLPSAPEPTPLDLTEYAKTRPLASVARLAHIGAVTTRRLGPVMARRPFVRDPERRRAQLGEALALTVHDLGVTFVKLGQLLASSPSIAGQTLADAMRSVLDDGPAVPFAQVRKIIEADLGKPLDAVFAEFAETPFAAASLAVVHRARLHDGTVVAVKVLRPKSARLVATDLNLVRPFVRGLAKLAPVGVFPAIPPTVDGLAEQLAEELDLRNEAAVMEWYETMVERIGARGVRVPAPIPEGTGRRVLTMEFITGTTIDDLEAIAEGSIDARASIEALIESWFALALCAGVFHGDMHAGNLLLTPDGEVALLDWGIVGRLPGPSLHFFRRSLEGALGDESAWPDVRDHMLSSMPPELLATVGITPDDFLVMVRAQTLMIMTSPFSELDLMMLTPGASIPDQPMEVPSSPLGWVRLIRAERKRIREAGGGTLMDNAPPRGEMLLIKQLVFFERYGKLFLGDKPLIFNPDVYRLLLDATTPTKEQ
jgi:hypothetical protein